MCSQDQLDNVKEVERLRSENQRLRQLLAQGKQEQVEYLQNVSHQLVAPLNAIKWHVENLTAGRLGVERGRKVLRSIYSQATIAVHLAKNFALMTNLEADHALSTLKEPLEPVNMCKLMINLADDFQPLSWDKRLNIRVVDIPLNAAPDVLVMKQLVSQVFSNIIENATKYSHEDSDIVISGEYNSGNETVSVHVKNNGIALPTDIRKVFERGYRGEQARNKYPAGTGFGLYIAKRIVELHEGEITVTTGKIGEVTFSVTLPVSKLKGKARTRDAKDSASGR